jgi:gluconokinase
MTEKRDNEHANATRGEEPIDPLARTLSRPRPSVAAAVVMGVSGAGKSTIGAALAERLDWEFVDGDSLHPPTNVAKMRAGQPLDDRDREPWLDAIAAQIDSWIEEGTPGIITCSALKRRYRDRIIAERAGVRLIYLRGSRELVARRLTERRGHFMPASLLDSQFTTLEAPAADEDAIAIDIDRPAASMVDQIVIDLSYGPKILAARRYWLRHD